MILVDGYGILGREPGPTTSGNGSLFMKGKFAVRDTRNGEWLWVYRALIADSHISATDKVVYAALASFGGCKDIYPDYDVIVERSSVSRKSVGTSLKRLAEAGYIHYESGGGRGKANEYLLLKQPDGCPKCKQGKSAPVSKQGKSDHKQGKSFQETGYGLPSNKISEIDKELDKNKTHSVLNQDVKEVISLFQRVNPNYGNLFKRNNQRNAVVRLLGQWPRPKLDKIIEILPQTNARKYAPTITTPLELEERMGKLIAFIQKERDNRKGKDIIGI